MNTISLTPATQRGVGSKVIYWYTPTLLFSNYWHTPTMMHSYTDVVHKPEKTTKNLAETACRSRIC